MIDVTMEFQGRKYRYGSDYFETLDEAEKCARIMKREFPKAQFFIADREAHVFGCLSLYDFEMDYPDSPIVNASQ